MEMQQLTVSHVEGQTKTQNTEGVLRSRLETNTISGCRPSKSMGELQPMLTMLNFQPAMLKMNFPPGVVTCAMYDSL